MVPSDLSHFLVCLCFPTSGPIFGHKNMFIFWTTEPILKIQTDLCSAQRVLSENVLFGCWVYLKKSCGIATISGLSYVTISGLCKLTATADKQATVQWSRGRWLFGRSSKFAPTRVHVHLPVLVVSGCPLKWRLMFFDCVPSWFDLFGRQGLETDYPFVSHGSSAISRHTRPGLTFSVGRALKLITRLYLTGQVPYPGIHVLVWPTR